jgi:molecular chaperone DnaJ
MDLYIVLGVAHGASESEIKRAYRRLARRYHPDINPGDRAAEARFQQVLAAYETLIDPVRRSRYDAGEGVDAPESRGKSGFEGFDFSSQGPDYSATFGDLFAEVLSQRGARSTSAERGADLHRDLQLSFEDALAGSERGVSVTRRESCGACAGSGVRRALTGPCPACQGRGVVRSVRGHMVFSRHCSACAGTGSAQPRACEACAATGQQTRSELVRVRIPAGIADGERVRVAGKGNAGRAGGPTGDLFITVRVAPHPRLRREGDDLHLVVPVAVHEAALGARVEIETPDGPARLRVPPGTQSGHQFRLRGRGAASARAGTRGDLVVEVRLMLPKVLDERSRQLLREFGRLNDASVREGR